MDVTRMDQSETIQMFKSKLRFQIRFWFFKMLQRQNLSKFPDTETSVRESVRRKRIYRASLTGTTGQDWRVALLKLKLFLISADGIFLNHLSQDIRGTNSSAVWRSFHIGQPLFYSCMFEIFQGLSILASLYLKSFRYLIAYKNLLRAIENIGIAVVYGIRSRLHLDLLLH